MKSIVSRCPSVVEHSDPRTALKTTSMQREPRMYQTWNTESKCIKRSARQVTGSVCLGGKYLRGTARVNLFQLFINHCRFGRRRRRVGGVGGDGGRAICEINAPIQLFNASFSLRLGLFTIQRWLMVLRTVAARMPCIAETPINLTKDCLLYRNNNLHRVKV